jgi:histidinol-phosphate aminotransferase
VQSVDPNEFIRADFAKLDTYTPVKPLHVLAEEIGVPVEKLVKLDANEVCLDARAFTVHFVIFIVSSLQNLYGPDASVFDLMKSAPLHIYPDPESTLLRTALAAHLKVSIEQIVCGCGSDELLDLVLRLFEPSAVITCSPTFGMYRFLGLINHTEVIDVPRLAEPQFRLDTQALVRSVRSQNSKRAPVVFLASPNNPTGGLVSEAELLPLLAERCVVIVDEAYAEFASDSALRLLSQYRNLIVMRTFSKWAGLAGLRVGYVVAEPSIVAKIVQIKQPYNINVVAETAACAAVHNFGRVVSTSIAPMINERDRLRARLADYQWLEPAPSDANFVLCRVLDRPARAVERALRARGILVRCYAGGSQKVLDNYIRVSCGRPHDTDALLVALDEMNGTLPKRLNLKAPGLSHVHNKAPRAILWDMVLLCLIASSMCSIVTDSIWNIQDGVLADVSTSYRRAIIETAAAFGATIDGEDIRVAKHAGNANNDWVLTQRLCALKGVQVDLQTVTDKFQLLYKGDPARGIIGLEASERLIPSAQLLKDLVHSGIKFTVVTGRPRSEAIGFLQTHSLAHLFPHLVCMGETDAPKPSGTPVTKALSMLGLQSVLTGTADAYAFMIGDTVDDVRAALNANAGVIPLGICAPGDHSTLTLYQSGAARVLLNLEELRVLCHVKASAAESAAVVSGARTSTISRATKETKVSCTVNLDGTGVAKVSTKLGFYDHMLTALAKHSKIDIELTCVGDLEVDDHHSVEDCALVLGACIDQALGDKRGIRRYGSAYAPLDEALSRAVIDFSGRPSAVVQCHFAREMVGQVSTEMLTHALQSLATAARATLHVDVLRGDNDHHRAESAFKALALALRQAVAVDAADSMSVPSTKGSL